MGAFYGSIHVRTDDYGAVLGAIQAVVRLEKCEVLLAPTLRGWTPVYPSAHGQDPSITRALARRLPFDIVHVLVHDDDVFAYSVYRRGKLLDEYNSLPEYSGPISTRKKNRLAGHPERFADLLKDTGTPGELKNLLSNPPTSASDFLARFAALLDLPNALTSYEYLGDGETDGIERFDQFVRVPEVSEEDRWWAEAKATVVASRQALRDAGLLVGSIETPKGKDGPVTPVWCAGPGSGFLLVWASPEESRKAPLLQWTAPWSGPATPLGIELDARVHALQTSPSGRYLAAGFCAGNWSARLWNLPSATVIAEVSASRVVQSLTFTADERTLAFRSSGEVVLIDCETGRQTASISIPGETVVALQPTGQHLVADCPEGLAIVEIPTGRLVKTLCIGDVVDTSAMQKRLLAKLRQQRGTRQRQLEQLRDPMKELGDDVRQRFEEAFQQFESALDAGQLPGMSGSGKQGLEQVRQIAFSPAGEEMYLATSAGV